MSIKRIINIFTVFLLLVNLGLLPTSLVQAATSVTRYVATASGNDSGNCSSSTAPCITIQYAVNNASSGDTILVAKGTYTYNQQNDWCSAHTSIKPTSVICYVDKSLTILGGYSTTNWSSSQPLTNPTIIDGQNSYRGVEWVGYTNKTSLYLDMEGITIQNGLAQGPNNNDSGGYGAGMLVQYTIIILKNMVFSNNQSNGQSVRTGIGGDADGAGLRIESAPGTTSLLQDVDFDNNRSYGGSGVDRGGVALGALFIYASTVTVKNSTFTNNLAQGGNSTGNGIGNGLYADALGGAMGIENAATVTLQHIIMTGNQVIGGNSTTYAGGAYGGAILVESTNLFSMSDAYLANNTAKAGTASTGGNAAGGAFNAMNDNEVTFNRVQVFNNTATGGDASSSGGNAGPGGGGGLYIIAVKAGSFHATVNNAIIADNGTYQGSVGVTTLGNGSGGGVVIQGQKADFNHATFARNQIGANMVLAQGLMVEAWDSMPASVNLNYSVFANHTGGGTNTATIVVDNSGTLTFKRGLFAGNSRDTNNNNLPISPGTINGLSTMISASTAGFISPGSPNYNYHIRLDSPAKDQAIGSTTADDIDGQSRPYGNAPDLGADEYWPFGLSANPGDGSAILDWTSGAGILAGGVGHYEVVATCQQPSSIMAQAICGQTVNVGTATTFTLTRLTNGTEYSLVVNAYDPNGTLIASSIITSITPEKTNPLFLPIIFK